MLHPLSGGEFEINGIERTFVYHVPRDLKPKSRLIIAYHGTAMTARMMQIMTGHEFDEFADRDQNAIIVYPQGYKNNWNDCRKTAPFPAKQLNLDDVGFTGQIIKYFIERYNIDTTQIYAVGYSNGGAMVMKLAAEQPGWFKGVAVISANMPVETNNACYDTRHPISLLYIRGMQDPIIPYDGGEVVVIDGRHFGAVQSTQQTLQHWLDVNRCDTLPFSTLTYGNHDGAVTAMQENYYSSITHKRVAFIKVLDGGHTIPNRNFRITTKKIGKMNEELDAPQIIWDFFVNLKYKPKVKAIQQGD
ncbi:MAG: prolyl oligopeptidase family serine peptidase [Flavipsychrobacter sp.]|nr:prolyl oligopeptidase family serine peptidase [Flavipsychrobacter sp.]